MAIRKSELLNIPYYCIVGTSEVIFYISRNSATMESDMGEYGNGFFPQNKIVKYLLVSIGKTYAIA